MSLKMIKLKPISRNQFKKEILLNKTSVRWMIWYAINKINGISYFNYFNQIGICGVCFIINKESHLEVGILIRQSFRNKGLGKKLINELIKKKEKPIVFTVSNSNSISKSFFDNFVESGQLDSCQKGYNTIYKTLN